MLLNYSKLKAVFTKSIMFLFLLSLEKKECKSTQTLKPPVVTAIHAVFSQSPQSINGEGQAVRTKKAVKFRHLGHRK